MALTYHPKPGMIVMCDFSQGFKMPEMTKKRPVIVLSPYMQGREQLATVVPLSTTKLDPMRSFHYGINMKSLPNTGFFQGHTHCWVKADMVCAVGFHRLDMVRMGKDASGKRIYYTQRLGDDQMHAIWQYVLHGMGVGYLAEHLK